MGLKETVGITVGGVFGSIVFFFVSGKQRIVRIAVLK
jgi:hypothetical protein